MSTLGALLPRSLFGRMVIVLVGGLLTAQMLSLAILMNERARVDLDARALRVAQRVTDAVKIFDSLTPEERATLAPLISSRTFNVSLSPSASGVVGSDSEGDSTAKTFAGALRGMLGKERLVATGAQAPPSTTGAQAPTSTTGVQAPPSPTGAQSSSFTSGPQASTDAPFDDIRSAFSSRPGRPFFAQVLLDDGALLNFSYVPPSTVGGFPPSVLIALFAQLVVIVILTLVAVHWATRPLSDLAAAAERIGVRSDTTPLDESGPAEVRHAARAFNRMQSRIANYLRDRTRLLAAISHDLKTPITRLRLRSELLADEELKEKFVRDLQEMETMVGRALEFAKGADASEPAQPINVVALVESLQDDYREGGALVEVEGTARSYVGRPLAIKQCLRNLVDNAVKYGGRVKIILADADESLSIRIRDSGKGIPEEMLERVFDPFFRLEESRNRDTGGTGLGLSIARSVAETHHGNVTLRNATEGGLEATLTLPRHRGAPA